MDLGDDLKKFAWLWRGAMLDSVVMLISNATMLTGSKLHDIWLAQVLSDSMVLVTSNAMMLTGSTRS